MHYKEVIQGHVRDNLERLKKYDGTNFAKIQGAIAALELLIQEIDDAPVLAEKRK